MSALRGLEREKEISLDLLVEAIESALLIAYHRTEGSRAEGARRARPEDRARHGLGEGGPERRGQRAPRVRRHPDRFRPDRRDHRQAGHPAAPARRRGRADVRRVRRPRGRHRRGVVQQGKDPRNVLVDLGKLEAILPPQEQVPGEDYEHGDAAARLRRAGRARAHRGPSVHAVAHAPEPGEASSSRWRSRRSPTAPSRSRRSPARPATAPRSPSARARSGRQRQGRLHRPDGRPGAQRHGRAARREDRHRRLVGRPGRVGRERAVAGAGVIRSRSSTPTRGSPG